MANSWSRSIAALLGLFATLDASATTWIWPDLNLILPGPCAGTLQACINNAASGDTVQIGSDSLISPDRYTGISGDLVIAKSLTLAPMPGIDAVFEGGSIFVQTPMGASGDVTLRGLILRGGRIDVNEGGSTSAAITLDQLRLVEPPAGQCAIDLGTTIATTVTPNFVVSANTLTMTGAGGTNRTGICVFTNGATYQASVVANVIDAAESAPIIAIAASAGSPAGAITARFQRNWLRLSRAAAGSGIMVNTNSTTSPLTLDVVGNVILGAGGSTASENAAVVIKAHQAQLAVINNTIADGGVGIHVAELGTGTIGGRIANNLLTKQSVRGFRFLGTTVANDHNLLHDITANELGPGGALGAGTVTGDPLIDSMGYPRPSGASPAFNVGDNAALPAFTLFDADGERRIQDHIVDIGAIEFSFDGAIVHDATVANSGGNVTNLDADAYPFAPFTTDHLIVTPLRVVEGMSAGAQNLGVYQSNALPWRWAIFHQDLTGIPVGRRYTVLLPWESRTSAVHAVSAANIPPTATAETEINHAELNNQAAAIAVVTPNWNSANEGVGVYHDRPVTLVFRGTRWRIRNDDAASMNSAIGAAFNLAIAPPFSPNAFVAELGSTGAREIPLAHPLLDDNACAAPVASRRVKLGDGSFTLNSTPFALEYREPINANDIGRWYIVAEDAIGFSANNAFNVIVDGSRAHRCRTRGDALFADSFE